MNLNASALERVERLLSQAAVVRVAVQRLEGGCRLIDCGVEVPAV